MSGPPGRLVSLGEQLRHQFLQPGHPAAQPLQVLLPAPVSPLRGLDVPEEVAVLSLEVAHLLVQSREHLLAGHLRILVDQLHALRLGLPAQFPASFLLFRPSSFFLLNRIGK